MDRLPDCSSEFNIETIVHLGKRPFVCWWDIAFGANTGIEVSARRSLLNVITTTRPEEHESENDDNRNNDTDDKALTYLWVVVVVR